MNIIGMLKQLGIDPENIMEFQIREDCDCGTIGAALDRLLDERKKDNNFTKAEFDELREFRHALELAVSGMDKLVLPNVRCYDLAIEISKRLGFPVMVGSLEIAKEAAIKLQNLNAAAMSEMAEKRRESHEKQKAELASMFDETTHRN